MLTKIKVLEVINNFPAFFTLKELVEEMEMLDNEVIKNGNIEAKKTPRNWEEIELKITSQGKVI